MSQKPSRRPSAIENVWWYVREYHKRSRDVMSWILETLLFLSNGDPKLFEAKQKSSESRRFEQKSKRYKR